MFLRSRVLIDPSSVTVTEKKYPKVPQLFFFLFFSLAPPFPFLHSLSSTIHYECVTGSRRLARGEQCVVTLSAALQLSAWFPTPSPSRPWRGCGGGGAAALSTPPPFLRHHPNQSLRDTIQTIHPSPCITAQCTTNNGRPCGSGLGESLGRRVITGGNMKYEMEEEREQGVMAEKVEEKQN